MRVLTDPTGRTVRTPEAPRRVVSIVPSQTELLFDLGLDEEIVGVTRFCVHPADRVISRPRVGGTKNLDHGLIDSLRPDLVIGNREENTREAVERLERSCAVWLSDVVSVRQSLDLVREVGELVGRADAALHLQDRLARALESVPDFGGIRVAYVIWRRPWRVAAAGTYIDSFLRHCGMSNVFADLRRYPEVTRDDLAARAPDVVLLASEPFPFREEHVAGLGRVLPASRVVLAEGEAFSWYGTRLLLVGACLDELHRALRP